MVRYFFPCFTYLLYFFCYLPALETSVSVSLDAQSIQPFTPIKGFVRVMHDHEDLVELSSFKWVASHKNMESKKLRVSKESSSYQGLVMNRGGIEEKKKLATSLFRFQIDGKEAGVYQLPAISVKIGGKFYQSHPVMYQVLSLEAPKDLYLESFVDAKKQVYPGEHFEVGYRIFYKEPIDITLRELPLLEGKVLRNVGDIEVRRYLLEEYSVHELRQVVAALLPGEYRFSSATLEGFHYKEDYFGQKTYLQPRVRATSPTLSLEVSSFPLEGKPDNFSGALGDFSFSVRRLGNEKLLVGDIFQVEFLIHGEGEHASIRTQDFLNELSFFNQEMLRLTDMQPIVEIVRDATKIVLEFEVLSPDLQEFPPVEFAFFNPKNKEYHRAMSQAIPLEVLEMSGEEQVSFREVQGLSEEDIEISSMSYKEGGEEFRYYHLEPIEKSSIKQTSSSVSERGWSFYTLIVLSIFFALLTFYWILRKQKKIRVKTSQDLLVEAAQMESCSQQFVKKLEKAFLARLLEQGWINEDVEKITELPRRGIYEKVRAFFSQLREQITLEDPSWKKVLVKAEILYDKIHKKSNDELQR